MFLSEIASMDKVGADLFTNAQANFLDVSYTEDSSVGSWVDKKYCVSPNVVSNDGSTSSAVSLFFLSWIMVGDNAETLLGIGLCLNSLHKLLFINHVRKSLKSSISTACLLYTSDAADD